MNAAEERWIKRLGNAPKDFELRLEYAAWLAKQNRHARSKLLLLDVKRKKLHCKAKARDEPALTDREWSQIGSVENPQAQNHNVVGQNLEQHFAALGSIGQPADPTAQIALQHTHDRFGLAAAMIGVPIEALSHQSSISSGG